MPRLLLIIPTLDRGGSEKQLSLLAMGLAERGNFDVHVACLTHGGPWYERLVKAGVSVEIIGKSKSLDLAAYWRLKRHIAALRPDIVHTWRFEANTYGRQTALANGVKHIIASERGIDRWKMWYELAIDRRLARRTAKIVTNSRAVQDYYIERKLPAEKFVVIPNGVEPATPVDGSARDALLAQLQLPTTTQLLGYVGPLILSKRIKDLIWATELLRVVRDDVHMLAIGTGPQQWRLERYAQQAGVGERVHFLGERADVAAILPHLRLLWLAGTGEGQSNAILEAMAAGVPVVASDTGGNRDLVIPNETGFLVNVGDKAGYSRKGLLLLEDPELAARMGVAGRERALQDFTVTAMLDRYEQLYQSLLA